MNLVAPKPETIKHQKHNEKKKEVRNDLVAIKNALEQDDKKQIAELHCRFDGKYGAYIKDWGKGLYAYNSEYGFNYEVLDEESIKENLQQMSYKIEGFFHFQEASNGTPSTIINNTVNTLVNVSVAIDEAKESISDLTALPQDQIDEINTKLDELKKIFESGEKKVTKWEKAKPIFKYIIDKGLDVAKIVLPLVLSV